MKKTFFLFLSAALTLLSLGACNLSTTESSTTSETSAASAPVSQAPVVYPVLIASGDETFTAQPLSADIIAKITGVSWVENEQVPLDALFLLTLSYVGFDEKSYTGQMIVAHEVAQDVCDIFKELYEARFPLEKMRLIDDYDADDNAAMADNNTSAFCYREIDGTDILSNHSYGHAVDINPAQNPYVRGKLVQPESSAVYLDRENIRPGMILRNDVCYNAFISRGWSWGGDWTGPIDYQHFEKTES